MKLTTLALFLALPATASAAEFPFRMQCTGRGAVESDTLQLMCGIVRKTLRLDTIDGPERGQPYGDTATKILAGALDGTPVTVTVRGEDTAGWHGSATLANGWDLATQLVSLGMAWPAEGSTNPRLAGMQHDAETARRGLWRIGNAVSPWEWRRTHPTPPTPAQSKAPFVVTDENLERSDWSTFDAQGSAAMAKFAQDEAARQQGESEAAYNDRMRYLLTQICYFRGGDSTRCINRVERDYPVGESTPTPLERGVPQ